MRPRQLLATAERVLDEPRAGMEGVWARAAALLARQALERTVRDVLIHKGGLKGHPSHRAMLIAVRSLIPRELAEEVGWAWVGLSAATHHHAYGLPPTATELRGWLDTVGRLVREVERWE